MCVVSKCPVVTVTLQRYVVSLSMGLSHAVTDKKQDVHMSVSVQVQDSHNVAGICVGIEQ